MFIRNEPIKLYWRMYPICTLLISVCLIVFLSMLLFGNYTSDDTLYRFGALIPESVMNGQWYRLLTSLFVHIGFMHLVMNMASLFIFCPPVEKMIGSKKFLIYFLLCGTVSNLFPLFLSPTYLSAGISGAIFAMYGFFLFHIVRLPHRIHKQDKQIILAVIVLDLVFSFLSPNISISSHVGGFAVGFILSFLFVKK